MSKLLLNKAGKEEILCVLHLTKEQFPIAFANKVEELKGSLPDWSQEEIENAVKDMEFQLELYYQPGYGLFAIESECVSALDIHSPYTSEKYEQE